MKEEAEGRAPALAPKRHHYIPQFYLKFFVEPLPGRRKPGVWRFERGVKEPLYLAPSVAAVERHYYSIPAKEGGQNALVEEILLKPVDGAGALLLQQVATGDIVFNHSERRFLSLFLGVMFVRVPARRRPTEDLAAAFAKFDMEVLAKTPGALESVLREMEKETGHASDVDVEGLRRYLLGDPIVKGRPVASLEAVVRLPLELAPIFYAMDWLILKSDDFPFLTSDNPVVYVDATAKPGAPVGLNNENVEVIFSLNPAKCLLAKHNPRLRRAFEKTDSDEELRRIASTISPETRYRRATQEEVTKVNARLIKHACQYVFSSRNDEAAARFITRRFGGQPGPQQTFRFLRDRRTGFFMAQYQEAARGKQEE